MRIKSFLVWGFLVISWMRGAQGAVHRVACSKALGLESGHIQNNQLSASSQFSHQARPALARFNNNDGLGGWCPDKNDKNPYLQVDLLTPHTITKLATQGADSSWVEQFTLTFSYDNISWFNYTVDGKIKFFKGNKNQYIPKRNNLTQPLTARAVRFHPVVDQYLSSCLRVELYGCQPSEDCNTPVGVETRKITDQQMSASSHWNQHYASNARLNNQASMGPSGDTIWGGWCTDKLNKNQYLQVDLGRVRSVSGVETQGYMYDMFVSSYKVNYSTDGLTWQSYKERGDSSSKIFQGNWDNDTVIKKVFSRRIFARYIRFNPLAWNKGGFICMRVEIYECLPTKGSVPEVSPPSETVELNRTSSVNLTCLVSGQPGAHMEWYKNGLRILDPPLSIIHRTQFGNGSVRSVLTLERVKYRDRGSIVSCTAWYPSLSINSTRNIHLLVHAPRPVMVITKVQSRTVQLRVTDPTPSDTAKYIVRYKTHSPHSEWVSVLRNKTGSGRDTVIMLDGLHPYTKYLVEVAAYYKDGDEGPYSVPHPFETEQAAPSGPPRDVVIIPRGKNTIRVSWSIPSAKDSNGKITKYEVVLYKPNSDKETFMNEEKTLSKDISDLETNQQYYVGVRAYTKVGPGPYSSNITYSTEETNQGSQITRALEKLNKVPVTDNNALKVMKEVKNITSKSSELLEKDISLTANILKKIVKTNATSADVGDHVLDTISHVMDAKTDVLQKTQKKYNTSAKFVKLLDEYLEKGGKFSKSTSNIAVHTQLVKHGIHLSVQTTKDKIAFNTTENSTSGENLENEASVTVPASVVNTTDNTTLIVVYYRTSKLFAPDYRKTEVCEDSFTTEKMSKVEPSSRSSRYTMENSTGDVVTESSPVLSASLRKKHVANLTTPVIIKFKMPHDQIVENSTRCVWWDFEKSGWSTEGCSLRGIVNDTIICECNHMTNFAALVDVDDHSRACGKHSKVLSLISYIGCALSILGLSLTIFTFGFFKKLRKDQIAAKILLHLCASLLCVLIVFVAGVERGGVSEDVCRIVAALVHYFLLVAFLWMLIEAYFMYQAFVKVFRDYGDYVMWKCAAMGWGIPFIVVIITLAVDKSSYGGKHYCRIGDIAFFAAFMAPVLLVILINTATFSLIMYKLATRPPNAADPDRGTEGLLKIKRAFGILILVGITWMFGFFAISEARLVFQYLFAIFNSLQGFAIFVFYCVIQKKVRECWWALLTCNLRSLNKSKSLYTDSYDRRRLSSASRVQLDAMRARSNTNLSQVMQMPLRKVSSVPDVIVDKVGRNNCHYHSNMVYEDDRAQVPTVSIEPSDYQLSGSQGIEVNESMDELATRLSYRSGSRTPSLRSHALTVTQSRDPSVRGSYVTVNSARSTPKVPPRVPRINGLRSAGALNWSRECMPAKETLKRTVSHTPEVQRPANNGSSLRRTCSLGDEMRFSADFSVCSDQTSCESLSSEAQTPTIKKHLGLPFENLGEQIVSPLRGSVRGIVGYVETTVENFDLLIDLERQRSLSSPVTTLHQV
ncbi:hypothetical protein ACROYT_G043325 [Oculina patagonica]